MSKIFSLVELETNTGITDKGYVAGIPDWQDIEKHKLYKRLLKNYKDIEYINVKLSSYCYGNGQGVKLTSTKDLEYISSLENFTQCKEVDWLQDYKFTIYPHET